MKKYLIPAILLLALSTVFVSCKDDDVIAVKDFTMSKSEALLFSAGGTLELSTAVTPIFATHQMVTWSSSNPAVASVNPYGLVTALTEGLAVITATITKSGLQATCSVTVEFVVPPTAETIVDYETYPEIQSLVAFLNNNNARYNITLMSSKLEAWRAAYAAAVPLFDKFVFALPSTGTSTSSSPMSMGWQITYTSTGNLWPFVTTSPTMPTLVAMTGENDNPNSDATFTELRRVDRTSSSAWGDPTPHSSTLTSLSGAVLAAVRGIFTPIATSTSIASQEAPNLIGLLNASTGWRIFQDDRTFWFRSKADPNDWFVAVRQ
jgi:hypothetical protein